jgi:hypothetical protein
MTNPRTEAVAKAIYLSGEPEIGNLLDELDAADYPSFEQLECFYNRLAQAAEKALIEALMEPSESMIEAGMRFRLIEKSTGQQDTSELFRAMLKAAGEGQ